MSAGAMKTIVVAALITVGVIFLAEGIGVGIPLVKYEKLEAYGVPAGLALLAAGVLLARFWKVTRTEVTTRTRTKTTTTDEGESTTTTTTTTTEKKEITTTMKPPGY